MSIPAERLREDQTILVRGKISYSRLAAQITGEELARSIENARKRGSLYPTTKPHTTISLIDAVVTPLDPNNPTTEEQYVGEKIYTVKNGDNAGKRGFSHDDTSPTLPQVFEPTPEGKHHQVVLDNDLDSGLDVTLVLRTFKPANYEKRGLGLQQVILHEPIRYYQAGGGADPAALSALGITIEGPVTRVSAADAAAVANKQADPRAEESTAVPTVVGEDGLAMPGAVGEAPAPQQQQAQAAPAAQDAPMAQLPTTTPAAPQGGDAARIAELEAQLAAARGQSPQGGSAFDGESPWEGQQGAGISL